MKTKLEIINEAKRIRDECEQIMTDCEYWNRTHPNEKPLVADPDGQLKRTIEWAGKVIKSAESQAS